MNLPRGQLIATPHIPPCAQSTHGQTYTAGTSGGGGGRIHSDGQIRFRWSEQYLEVVTNNKGEEKIYKLAMEYYVVGVSLHLPLAKSWIFIGGMGYWMWDTRIHLTV